MPSIKSQLKNWHKIRLGEIADVLPGFAFKSSEFRKDSGIPVIKIKNITDDYNVSIDDSEYLDKSVLNEKTQKYLVGFGDILVAMTGATAGKVGKFRLRTQALFNQRVAKIIPQKVNPDFLWILLGNQDTVGMLYRLADGAAQPNMSGGQIENIEFTIPENEADQERIASVIVTYDDLIENNTRRIKILEEIAQAIYREWFVYFRFPGHEKVKMIDSKTEFGKIPEGWKIGKVKDVVDLLSGYAFKSGTFIEGGRYKIITIKSVHNGQFKPEGSDTIEIAPEKMPEHCYLKDGDTLLSLTGNIGRACLVYGEDLLLNQRVAKLDYKKSNRPFVYGLFRNSDFQTQLQNLAIGAAQQNLSPVQTAELSVVVPAVKILDSFNELVEPMIKEIVELNKQNFVLRQARDLLLPKLVTGEIRV